MRSSDVNPYFAVATKQSLKEQIESIECRHRRDAQPVTTGWEPIDRALGGLSRAVLHEWFGLCDEGSPSRGWTSPLFILAHLARRASNAWSVWIGRRIWPAAHTLARGVTRALFVEAPSHADRLWSLDAALRCPGIVVIGDASSFDTAATRRLQLAAEAGGSFALLARPPRDLSSVSVAATRWRVSCTPATTDLPRWTISLVRCKGLGAQVRELVLDVERSDSGPLLAVPAHVAERPRAASASA